MAEILSEITKEVESRLHPVVQGIERLMQKFRNPAQASFNLGCSLVQRGEYAEAKYRFRFTLWREPQNAQAWHNLAICHFAMNETAEGVAAIRKSLAIAPKNEAALFLLATLENGKYATDSTYQPHTTPVELIKSEFSGRATGYDAEEMGGKGYQGHFSLYEILRELAPQPEGFRSVLDAGCGTGLLGMLLRPFCQKLTGLDISPPMLERAKERRTTKGKAVYNHLLEGEIRSHLLHQQQPLYDCIAAANVAPIMGGLAPMVDGAVRSLMPGGWLIFTIIPLPGPDSEGYQLLPAQRRFAHSTHYIQHVAQKAGLQVHSITHKPLYSQAGCQVIVLQKHG